jgi:ketosteroid isomerase-like protein
MGFVSPLRSLEMKKDIGLIIILVLATFCLTGMFAQEIQPETKTEAKAEAKTEIITDAKAEDKAGGKTEPKVETKADAKTEPKTEEKAGAKADPKVEAKPATKTEPKVEPKTITKPEAKTKPETKTGIEEECDLLTQESKLDKKVKESGSKEAFNEFFSKDAVIISSKAVEGKYWAAEQEEGKTIAFKPFAVKSSSLCDYGFVVGDWEERKGSKVLWGGQYINVWKKVKNEWKLYIHAKTLIPRNFKMESQPAAEETQIDYEKKGHSSRKISIVENDFFKTLRDSGWAKTYDAFAGKEIMKIRPNCQMLRGKKQVFLKSVVERGFLTGKISEAKTAKGDDVAVVWGDAESRGAQPYQKGSFLHIWTRDDEGAWKLAVDFLMLGRAELKKSIL